jgi:CTP:molybdopterin cytidylyltransferase MocA
MMQAPLRYGAVILAGGLSSRLGRFKPLVRLGGKTLLQCAAELFRETGVQEIVVVAGHRAPETLSEAARLGLGAVVNEAFAQGMFTSVQAGLRALPHGLDAFFVLPVDIPLVRPHTVRLLQERFATATAAVLHPVFAGQRGHPPLVRAACAQELLAWTGSGGLAGALDELESRLGAAEVPVADQNIHFDVDTPEDLAEALLRLERRGVPTQAEALALLDLHQAGERGHAHGRGVALVALALANALNAQGGALDLGLVEAAALLHDIAKGQPRHEAAGAALLDHLGFGRAARIVAAHRDIPPEDAPDITEREVVYFADKLVWGSSRICVEARFQQKLDAFAGDDEACAAIRRRLGNALDMQRRIERATGMPMEDLVPMQEPA